MGLIPLWYFAWGIPWAVAAAVAAHRRSRNPAVWAVLGFFLSFLALVVLWIMGDGAWGHGARDEGEDADLEGHRPGETTQMWRTPPSMDRAAGMAWWTSSDAGAFGHRSGDPSHRR